MMADVWSEAWRDRLQALPPYESWQWQLSKNDTAERLTCILCDHGHEEHGDPPEWLVSYRVPGARVAKGLHERCRKLQQA